MNYSENQKYFKPVKLKPAIIMIIIGVIVFMIGAGAKSGGAIFVSLLLIAGGVGLIVLMVKRPSDQDIDNQAINNIKDLKKRAMSKLGIDEDEVKEIEPIVFYGYDYDSFQRWKVGKDGLLRTDRFEAVMLFFSENEVHCYTLNFNMCDDKKTESTDVYFYTDIVSVSTASESVTYGSGESYNYEAFKLTTAGGTALNVSVNRSGSNERSINAMRQLLRNKKAR